MQSVEKDEVIDKRKKKKNKKVTDNVKSYEDYDKLIYAIDSPFKRDEEWDYILSEMFREMKKSNENMFKSIVQVLPHSIISNYNQYVDFENLDKKKRVIRKVIGIKIGGDPIETERAIDE